MPVKSSPDSRPIARLGGPPEELAWLAAHGRLHRARVGESMTRDADMQDAMTIVLSGHMVIHVDRGLGPRKVMESSAGDVAGWLP